MKTLGKITLFIIIAKGFGFAKEFLLVSRYGFSKGLDEYNLIIITSLASAGFLVSVINNYFIEYFKNKSSKGVFKLFPKLFYFSLPLPLIYIVVMKNYTNLSSTLIVLGALIITIYSFSAILAAFIMAKKKLLNTYLEFIPAFLLCLVMLFFKEIKPTQLVLTFLIGIIIQGILYLQFILKNRFAGVLYTPISLVSLSTLVVSQFLVLLVPFIDSFVVIKIGQGELAGFSFAQRLIGVGVALITMIATRYILPLLSTNSSVSELKNFIKNAKGIFYSLLVIVVVAELLLTTLSTPEIITKYFAILLIYVPFYTYNIIMINAHVALGNYKILLFTAVIGISVKLTVYLASFFSDFLWVPWSLVAMSVISALYINSRNVRINVTA